MKKIVLTTILGFITMSSFGQNKVDLTIKWNLTQNRYEVYAKPNFSNSSFTWGSSQITVVVPSSVPDNALTVSSVNAGGWNALTNNQVFAPSDDPAHDFYAVQSSGQPVVFNANSETLLYTFTFPNGQCVDGVRLFVNGVDPSSTPAMKGGDYKNTIDNGALEDVYNINYNNTGTVCTTCNITAPELIK